MQAYVSVLLDPTSVTITIPKPDFDSLSQQLSVKGLKVKPVGLTGRFHSTAHSKSVARILDLCASNPSLQFPPASSLLVPLRSNSDAQVIINGSLHETALKAILAELADWHLTISGAISQLTQFGTPRVLQVGLVDSIPSSIIRDHGLKTIKMGPSKLLSSGLTGIGSMPSSGIATPAFKGSPDGRYPSHAIAVVGMACKFPGADSIDEFWQIITAGTSMCEQMPSERFSMEGLRRSPDNKLKFWGNFVRDIDAFDHKFFKKSSREAASMDPQQRLLLQVAYQALESAGYFGELGSSQADDIGVYLGVCANDYNDNVASHSPNAYSSLGTLRAFLSGKISHFFGWTSPSITYDTACSSSAVAIHAACKALQTGDCSRAVAGGASLYTSPNFYQNLAAASFLSPTGPTKPFDAKGDGYCRGEGIGLVVLKRLSDAIADGDTVMGVIGGIAVNQNKNSTSITVPHGESQMALYEKVASQAGVNPKDVSFVEAHGTGTPVGDPIEFESIRKVFGGSERSQPLHIASVKGNIGHLEGASGVAALMKTVLMMRHSTIPVQANFSTLNPKISSLDVDMVAIPTWTQKWESTFQIACINNYGAAGSNAAMIVCQPTSEMSTSLGQKLKLPHVSLPKYPLFISANSPTSLSAYCAALQEKLPQLSSGLLEKDVIPSITFNLADKQNRSLPHLLATTVSSLAELKTQLNDGAAGSSTSQSETSSKAKPVVLVFGGQVNNAIGLSKDVYESSVLLRSHLDHCDKALRSAGLKGLYPHIFRAEPVEDIVNLHTMLFSLQYACAKSWMDSGLKVDALVGHSFGQLTALCVSGGLSLNDGIKLIAGRAALMQKFWGIERGSMISVEAELDIVLDLVSSINQAGSHHKVEIACYNGPTSHVLVGTEASINAVEDELVHHVGPIKYKKLNVTHGFHSEFTEPLLPSLKKISEELVFRDPHIPLETCSETESWLRAEPKLIAEHTRTPVYFGKAVERLAQRLGSCSWLEAGSAASVTSMVRRALGTTESPSHSFHPVNLTASGGMGSLADITVNLWKAGHKVQFWPFHRSQKHEYSPLSLPPYQFEKSRHWLTWLDSATGASAIPRPKTETGEPTLLTFIKYLDQNQRQAVFCVDPRSEEYKLYVQGHAVLAEPLCPAPLYVELVSQAAMVLNAGSGSLTYIPCVEDLEIKAPLGMNDRAISILLKRADVVTSTWDFELSSQSRGNGSTKIAVQQHATGKVSLETGNPKLMADFDRYERLIGDRRYNDLVADPEAEAMRGALVYKVFGKVVTYKDYYKGVRSVYAKDQEVAGLVTLPSHDIKALQNTVCNPLAVDNFVQVSGLHVNSLNEIGDNEVFICTKIDRIQPSPKFKQAEVDTRAWIVYSSFQRTSDKELVNDIFVFNSKSKSLVMIILGVRFTKVLISSLAKVLSRANIDGGETATAGAPHSSATVCGLPEESPVLPALTSFDSNQSRVIMCGSGPAVDVDLELQKLIHKVTEVPMDAFTNKSTLEELGIDSLMITEVLGEMRTVFEVDIPAQDLLNLADIKSLSDYLRSKGVGSSGQDQSFPRTDSDSDSMTSTSSGMMSGTPPTPMSTRNTYVAHVSQLPTDTQKSAPLAVAPLHNAPAIQLPAPASGQSTCLVGAQQVFQQIRYDYDIYTKQTGFANFWEKVYPTQTRLVLAYIVEAFATCGCPLASLQPGQKLPPVTYLPKHSMLMAQLYEILKDGNLIYSKDSEFVRSDTPVDKTPSATIYGEILRAFPQHASEHQLLHITGSAFGDCLTGAADPLQLLFRSKANKEILEDVYTNGPMYKAISKLLGSYLGKAFANPLDGGKFHILEVGGGTGGTTKYIVDFLIRQGVPFSYTFTDISGSLVAAARKTFAGRDMMDFMVIDIEKEPAEKLRNHYHCIISTNCIHATRNLTLSTQHMRQMLRPDGFVSLVEFTRNIYWFDLVFGLLEGWWLFEDGRKHVLTNEWFWNNSMRSAGFKHVTWTDGRSEEARTLRIITGFAAEAESDMLKPKKAPLKLECETVVYKRVGNNSLLADIYYPHDTSVAKRPIGMHF